MGLETIKRADYLVIGAGIVGLSIARTLLDRDPTLKVLVLEKEPEVGLHASGRNSGVLHSGIYYKPDSLKAKFCALGSKLMADYCQDNQLPLSRIGKIILPTREGDWSQTQLLRDRAKQNGARAYLIDKQQLKELQPNAYTATDQALYCPDTSVVDPGLIVRTLKNELIKRNCQLFTSERVISINTQARVVTTHTQRFSYGHLINAAGLFADRIADMCGTGKQYRMLPFKGLYYEVKPSARLIVNHLLYPVPDMNVPFLGVHFTRSITGKIYAGPTALLAFGREQYHGLTGVSLGQTAGNLYQLSKLYLMNKQSFRQYAHDELKRYVKKSFVEAARALLPTINGADLVLSKKVGIRAQLFNVRNNELLMDFHVEESKNETHILNAVSPGFTSAFSFSDYLVNRIYGTTEKVDELSKAASNFEKVV